MSVFLKIEKNSNIIGEKSLETVLIPVSNIQQISSTSDGRSLVYVSGKDQPIVCKESVEDLMYKCVVNLANYAV
jgi:hypothetical protein